jgi:hypothetical protein
MKKVYRATVEIDIYVYAENTQEADRLALTNFQREDTFSATVVGLHEVNDIRGLGYEDGQSIPWGERGNRCIATILENDAGIGK